MGGGNHNRLLLLIPSLRLRYVFHSSVFPQAHISVNFFETHLHFLRFEVLTAVKMLIFF
jgi:hypothetical protein